MSKKKTLQAQIKAQKAEIRALYDLIEEARLQQELDELRYRAERLRQELTEQNARCAPEEPSHHRTSETLGDLIRSKGIEVDDCEGMWRCDDCSNVVAFRR